MFVHHRAEDRVRRRCGNRLPPPPTIGGGGPGGGPATRPPASAGACCSPGSFSSLRRCRRAGQVRAELWLARFLEPGVKMPWGGGVGIILETAQFSSANPRNFGDIILGGLRLRLRLPISLCAAQAAWVRPLDGGKDWANCPSPAPYPSRLRYRCGSVPRLRPAAISVKTVSRRAMAPARDRTARRRSGGQRLVV